jgi:hypothetical protein
MFKKIKESIIVALSALLFAVPVLAPVTVHAVACDVNGQPVGCSSDIRSNLCSGANLSATNAPATGTECDAIDDPTTGGTSGFNTLVKNIINIFSLVVGIVAVIMILFAGFRYITSGGNDGNVGNAKNTILYAVIGLVIVALAQVIVRFVLTKTKI